MDEIFKTLIEKMPRKMMVGLFAMWMISDYAKSMEADKQVYVLIAMTATGVVSIVTHFLLEWRNPSNVEILSTEFENSK